MYQSHIPILTVCWLDDSSFTFISHSQFPEKTQLHLYSCVVPMHMGILCISHYTYCMCIYIFFFYTNFPNINSCHETKNTMHLPWTSSSQIISFSQCSYLLHCLEKQGNIVQRTAATQALAVSHMRATVNVIARARQCSISMHTCMCSKTITIASFMDCFLL